MLKVIDGSGASSGKFSSFQEFTNEIKVGLKNSGLEFLNVVKITIFEAD